MKTQAARTTTVGDFLRELSEMEAAWTEEDTSVLGEFRDQHLLTPYWRRHDRGLYIFSGYGPIDLAYDITGLGLIIQDPSPDLDTIHVESDQDE